MITVKAEPRLNRVRVQMSGMLNVSEIQAFEIEKIAAVRTMRLQSGQFDLLVETIGDVVQTKEAMEALAALTLGSSFKARRIATVRAGMLTRMQSRRMAKLRSGSEVFATLADAEAWLALP